MELARLIEVASGDERRQGLLDHLPETPDESSEVLLSDTVVASLIEAARHLRDATDAERFEAPELATRLERHPETRARMLIDNHARYQTWGLAEELMARSREANLLGDSPRGVRLARLAAAASDRLDSTMYGAPLVADLQARAWGNLGNAYRCAGRLRAAAAALREADDLLLDGTGDPLEAANLLSLRGSLVTAMGELDHVDELLDRAAAIYAELEETRLLAKVLVQKSAVFGREDPGAALTCTEQAEHLLESERESRLFLGARHNRIFWLIQCGRPTEAERLLEASRSLYARHDDPWMALHREWTEARIAFALDRVIDAEARFQILLERLLADGHQLDAACCALEISACRLALGDTRGASELAATMAHHLRAWGTHTQTREAWALYEHYLSLDQATEKLHRELFAYLQRAWRNPRFAFRPSLDPQILGR